MGYGLWVMGYGREEIEISEVLFLCFQVDARDFLGFFFFFSQNGETSLKNGAAAHKYKRSKTT